MLILDVQLYLFIQWNVQFKYNKFFRFHCLQWLIYLPELMLLALNIIYFYHGECLTRTLNLLMDDNNVFSIHNYRRCMNQLGVSPLLQPRYLFRKKCQVASYIPATPWHRALYGACLPGHNGWVLSLLQPEGWKDFLNTAFNGFLGIFLLILVSFFLVV